MTIGWQRHVNLVMVPHRMAQGKKALEASGGIGLSRSTGSSSMAAGGEVMAIRAMAAGRRCRWRGGFAGIAAAVSRGEPPELFWIR